MIRGRETVMRMSENTNEYVSVEQFEQYLENTLAESTNDRLMYCRTDVVADELGMSPQQVGQAFVRHKTRSESFAIERRTKSAVSGQGSKWQVELREEDTDMTYACPECSYTCRSMQALKGHAQTHIGELMTEIQTHNED